MSRGHEMGRRVGEVSLVIIAGLGIVGCAEPAPETQATVATAPEAPDATSPDTTTGVPTETTTPTESTAAPKTPETNTSESSQSPPTPAEWYNMSEKQRFDALNIPKNPSLKEYPEELAKRLQMIYNNCGTTDEEYMDFYNGVDKDGNRLKDLDSKWREDLTGSFEKHVFDNCTKPMAGYLYNDTVASNGDSRTMAAMVSKLQHERIGQYAADGDGWISKDVEPFEISIRIVDGSVFVDRSTKTVEFGMTIDKLPEGIASQRAIHRTMTLRDVEYDKKLGGMFPHPNKK